MAIFFIIAIVIWGLGMFVLWLLEDDGVGVGFFLLVLGFAVLWTGAAVTS